MGQKLVRDETLAKYSLIEGQVVQVMVRPRVPTKPKTEAKSVVTSAAPVQLPLRPASVCTPLPLPARLSFSRTGRTCDKFSPNRSISLACSPFFQPLYVLQAQRLLAAR